MISRAGTVLLPFLILAAQPLYSAEKIYAVFNGESAGKVGTKTLNRVRYVSINDVAKVCSAGVSWFRISGKLVLNLGSVNVGFFYGTKKVTAGSRVGYMQHPSVLSGSAVYVPVQYITDGSFQKVSKLKSAFYEDSLTLVFESVPNVPRPRLYSEEGRVSVVFDLAEPLKYRLRKESPRKYTVTFADGRVDNGDMEYGDRILESVALRNRGRDAACTLELGQGVTRVWDDYDADAKKLTITLAQAVKPPEEPSIVPPPAATGQAVIGPPEPAAQTLPKRAPGAVKKIVLDAGHGGDDSGAVGVNGTKEKDLNLAITLETARLLRDGGYEVLLTRADDVFIPLVERTEFANRNKTDLFISIHCNAGPRDTNEGFEIFFLNEDASDPEAAATAAFENSVIKLEKNAAGSGKREKLQQLLWALTLNEFVNESSELCSFITQEVTRRIKIKDRGIKQAGFYVLRGAQMPAVLVECAFVNNVREEALLNTARFQQQMCDAIYSGVREYDSRLTAAKKEPGK